MNFLIFEVARLLVWPGYLPITLKGYYSKREVRLVIHALGGLLLRDLKSQAAAIRRHQQTSAASAATSSHQQPPAAISTKIIILTNQRW